MFDSSEQITTSGTFLTSFCNSSSTGVIGTPGSDPLLGLTPQHQLALNSSLDDAHINARSQKPESTLSSNNEIVGEASSHLFLFSQANSLDAIASNTTTTSTNLTKTVAQDGTLSDPLTGLTGDTPLVNSLNQSTGQPPQIRDFRLRSAVNNYFQDGELDRNDMMAIFQNAEDGGVINGRELRDLQAILNSASYFNMDDYVEVLSNKVVNGNQANLTSGIGNLARGSSSAQMDQLVGKWFLGTDRPDAEGYTYQFASGSLFQNGISYQDVDQGAVGDCYFLAGLAATALQAPTTIQDMFIDNGDNTFTVRFYNSEGEADYVTVDSYLPTTTSGTFVYANMGDSSANSSNELWVALAEKAYAQLNESGWINQDNTNSYQGISGGYISDALEHITGMNASLGNSLDFNAVVNAFNSGESIGFCSRNTTASNVVPNHAYVLVDYNASTQMFTLFNPWGVDGGYDQVGFKPGTIQLNWSQIQASFISWDHTTA